MPKNNHHVRENASRHSLLYLIISLLFPSLTICFSINIYGQVAIQLSDLFKDITGKATSIKGLDDRLFVVTNDGLWVVHKNDKLFVLTDEGLSVIDKNGKPSNQKEISKITKLEKLGDQIFVITTSADLWYAIENEELNKVKEIKGIINAKTSGNQLYAGTSAGLWAVGKDIKTQYKEITGRINELETFGEKIFVNAANGSWIISKNVGQPVPISKIKTGITQLSPFGDRLFVNTNDRSWMIDKNHVISPIDEVTGNIEMLMEFGDQLFISSTDEKTDRETGEETVIKKSWVINKEGIITPLEEFKERPGNLGVFGDNLYIDVGKKLWRIDKDGNLSTVNGIEGRIAHFGAVKERLFVAAEKDDSRTIDLWIIDKNGGKTHVKEINARIYGTYQFGDLQLINTQNGSWLIDKDNNLFFLNERKERVRSSATFKDQFFVGTDKSLWIINSKDKKATILESIKGSVENTVVAGKYVYVRVSDPFLETFYRIDPKVTIKAKLSPKSWWQRLVNYICPSCLPAERVKAEAYYVDEDNKDPYASTFPKEFRFAEASSRAPPSESNGETAPPSEVEFSPQAHFGYEIGWCNNDVHYWAKDKWGNTFEQKAVYTGVPSQYLSIVLAIIFIPSISAAFILICFPLAPHYNFCHSLIMNPWFRNPFMANTPVRTYFSVWIIPLLLFHFNSLRYYILRRYSSSISKDSEISEWKDRFVYPSEEFYPENFGRKLQSKRKILLIGQSGIGKTSFLKHLTAYYASQDKPVYPAKIPPLYITLANYSGSSFEELVYNRLQSHGQISDKELIPMFLERGELMLFLDGVNELLNVADRQKLSEFVGKYSISNYICLSSQVSYPEVENIEKVELEIFGPEKVQELMRRRVNDKDKAENIIKNLKAEDYQLYSVPRDLEFAIEILNKGEDSLPKSRPELYKTVFSSIFPKWKETVYTDAEDNLYKRAYEMIVERVLVFDSVNNPNFQQITIDLFDNRFLVKREGNYNFRHDLIRSYLASQYFYPRWETLLEETDGKHVDNNWLEMLKFSCENIKESDEVKNLVYKVLEKSIIKDLAGNLFEWLRTNHPNKCESWEENFYTKYGKSVLNDF
jgi:GTPase SAR1 family protein